MNLKLETENLIIREYTPEDTDALYPILSDPVTMSFWPRPFTRREVEEWIGVNIRSYRENGFGRYAVVLKSTGKIIGDCGIRISKVAGETVYDFGYIIDHRYWGKGYATEAAIAIKKYAFDVLGIDVLHANMPVEHNASERIAQKIGMVKLREFDNEKNRGIRTSLYAVSRDKKTSID